MMKLASRQDCIGYGACRSICPQDCITLQTDGEGFAYPVADGEKCTECGLCRQVCPVLGRDPVTMRPAAFACKSRDEGVRIVSSSGGMFTELSRTVLAAGGVVFGAGYAGGFQVVHSGTDSPEGLARFRRSKYAQSLIGETYVQARTYLAQGRPVLFSGTPCQIGGLLSFLGKPHEKLLCVDTICHGVPSPLVWDKYWKCRAGAAQLKDIRFRDKIDGWKKHSVVAEFCDGRLEKEIWRKNHYMQGFLTDLYLRPSCHHCQFKSFSSGSDITLADFWGIRAVRPEFDDDRGTSIVFLNSPKGRQAFDALAGRVESFAVDFERAVAGNPFYQISAPHNPRRAWFFAELAQTEDVDRLIARYIGNRFSDRVYTRARVLCERLKKRFSR